MIRAVIMIGLLCVATDALAKSNNEMIKDCLNANGYDRSADVEKRLNTFDWQRGSYCVANFQNELHEKRLAEQREFLKKNPWYKGRNWNWEDKAEFTCHTEYHTGFVYCHRPKYIN